MLEGAAASGSNDRMPTRDPNACPTLSRRHLLGAGLAAFAAIVMLSSRGFEAENIDDFKGLNARNPWMAGLMLFAMVSLAGIPVFLGFWAKLMVLGAAVQGGMLWLALLGVNSLALLVLPLGLNPILAWCQRAFM